MQFQRENFNYHGGYLMYKVGVQTKFIARFKYYKPLRSKTSFQKFLTENFTVEEYFAQFDSGKTPLAILETKGYVSPNRKEAEFTLKQLRSK